MNTKPLIAVAIAFLGANAFASTLDPSYATYQRVVLGDTRIAAPEAAKPANESGRWLPGPFARYLMVNGSAKADALAQASAIGEQPSFVASEPVRVARQLSSYEQYQRSVLGRSDFEVAGPRAPTLNGESSAGLAASPAR